MARILLVDDDDTLRKLLSRMLSRTEHELEEARTGFEALDSYRKRPAEVVITDIIMPDKEGLETIRELRKINPEVKIIAMSGGGRVNATDCLMLARGLGANLTLEKPFSNEELLAAVSSVLAA